MKIKSEARTELSGLYIYTEKSYCVLSKWSFVNWWITSCKLVDYSKVADYKL